MIGAILVPLFASLAGKVLERLFDSGVKAFKGTSPAPAPTTPAPGGPGFSAMLQSGLAGQAIPPATTTDAGSGGGSRLGADDRDRALALGGNLWRAWYEPKLAASRYNDIQAA